MQEKVVFDTSIYIGVFNRGLYREEINAFNKIMYLVHPVLHELWMGAKGEREIAHLNRFGKAFVRLDRLVQPTPATQIMIGRLCNKCRKAGILDPKHPKHYNDICIAVLTRQIGATLVTEDISDFKRIKKVLGFSTRTPR